RAERNAAIAHERGDQLRDKLTELHAKTALQLVQRGKLKEALVAFQASLDAGYKAPAELTLDMARAHVALYQNEQARPLLEQILADPDAKKLHGSAELIRSYSTMGRQASEGLNGIRKALQMGLPPAEDAFARGLLAESSILCVDHLRLAL